MVWVTKKIPVSFFINTLFIRATETERLGHVTVRSTSVQWFIKRSVQRLIKRSVQRLIKRSVQRLIKRSVQRLIKRSVHFQRCLRMLPTKRCFSFLKLVHVLFRVSCVCKSGEACCYFLGYKMSLRKIMNDKSCVLCKEDDHAHVFCLAIVPLCLYVLY